MRKNGIKIIETKQEKFWGEEEA